MMMPSRTSSSGPRIWTMGFRPKCLTRSLACIPPSLAQPPVPQAKRNMDGNALSRGIAGAFITAGCALLVVGALLGWLIPKLFHFIASHVSIH
jgi:hypothetical protein